MRSRVEVPAALVREARRTGGVVTRACALDAVGPAVVRRLVAQGTWRRVTSGVLEVVPGQPFAAEWVGVLLGGPGSAIGGWAALHRHGVAERPRTVEVWLPAGGRRVNRDGWAFHEDTIGRVERLRGSPPTIRLDDALVDVGATLDLEGWVALLSEAVRIERVRVADVLARIEERTRLRGRSRMGGGGPGHRGHREHPGVGLSP